MKLIDVELTTEGQMDFIKWSASPIPTNEALDRLILAAAGARAEMEPAFPNQLPMFVPNATGVENPAWQCSIRPDGGLVLCVRHPGFGWLMFGMPDVDHFHKNLSDVLTQRDILRAELPPSGE